MNVYQKVFLAYVKAIKKRNTARTSQEKKNAEIICVIYKKWLDKNSRF